MNSVRAIQQLNKRELEAGINPEGSWHTDYRDTAFVYIGGLPFELSEGDIITIFSQYGEPVWVKLARDKETGKSRGFAWIKYEDQRSCDLAVDNLGGASIMDRVIRVDHARYKPRDDEDMRDNTMGELDLDPANEAEESDSDDDDRPLLPEEIELGRLMEKLDEDDPMRDSMIKRQQEKVDDALKKLKKQKRKEKERAKRKDRHSRRDRSRDRDHDKDTRRIKQDGEDGEDGGRDRRSHRREHRSRSRERSQDGDRRHRKSRARDDSEDKHRRHRSERTRDRSEDSRDRRHRHRKRERRHSDSDQEERRRSRPKSSRSPLPYRARSP
ncbi:u2 snrnp component ist3 protein [Stemphylium lycopersici]|uniref:RNA-binding domain-containing protein n=1 Tax=Stemphylium lycopersici TaxID=183478 RepID=A0A364NDG1_STELY|nr:u2 snrnp component ist3 protein [Stemphylium lycopersici]RAR15345.1 RNA-binding domain-containing protein [Stemphylium lycopersici]